ncbi:MULTISPECIES: FHA domain-containing protein [unclassified Actinobaculum]|uniref:FHA domain-containing protein n=1 Tax=unclassified Actinobaculum TaxID=2609299 RepID=UPI000D5264AE|nr:MULTISPECIES: FHA domain-containing protein [unclassified Actinobaculum]AWE42407.1 FHA domain-containing protein [Actinobaculum sp. 313]RTE48392.1 FHA domain-containing protein [Actinobaculum sp. 352]
MSEQFDPQRLSGNADPTATSRFTALGSAPELADSDSRRGLKPEEIAAIDSLPAGSALLIALSGPNSGARFLLNSDETYAGRHPHTDIFLDDFTVSRKHARFIREGNVFRVRDSGSLNGTYVNRERVDDCILHTGDEIQIGKFRLTFYPSRANA